MLPTAEPPLHIAVDQYQGGVAAGIVEVFSNPVILIGIGIPLAVLILVLLGRLFVRALGE